MKKLNHWEFIASKDGGMQFPSEDIRQNLKSDLLENPEGKYEINRLSEESIKQRKFFEGAVIPMWVYLDGGNYKSSSVRRDYREVAKREFNGELIIVSGKSRKVGRSTKGCLNQFVDKVEDFLEEQYGVKRQDVFNPTDYKYFKDVIFMNGEYDDYIDYLKAKGVLK